MDVHLRDLRYFVAVAEELHFTRAAERLHVSQPALSKQLRMFERDLGIRLLDRTSRTVALTAAGEALLPAARQVVADWDQARRQALEAAAQIRLVVGMHTAIGRQLLATGFTEARHRGHQVTLRLRSWDDPTAGLADGTSDLAVLWLPVGVPGISTLVLATEERWVALPTDHPLTAKATVAFTDLRDEPVVALPSSAGPMRDFWLALPERRGHEPQVVLEASSAEEAFEAVASGGAVVLLAGGNAALYQRPDVACRPVRDLSPARLCLAWRTSDTRPEVQELIRSLSRLSPSDAG